MVSDVALRPTVTLPSNPTSANQDDNVKFIDRPLCFPIHLDLRRNMPVGNSEDPLKSAVNQKSKIDCINFDGFGCFLVVMVHMQLHRYRLTRWFFIAVVVRLPVIAFGPRRNKIIVYWSLPYSLDRSLPGLERVLRQQVRRRWAAGARLRLRQTSYKVNEYSRFCSNRFEETQVGKAQDSSAPPAGNRHGKSPHQRGDGLQGHITSDHQEVDVKKRCPHIRRGIVYAVKKGVLFRVGNKGKGASESSKVVKMKTAVAEHKPVRKPNVAKDKKPAAPKKAAKKPAKPKIKTPSNPKASEKPRKSVTIEV
ncbi:histone H1/5 [Clonorchis sinensis]|uniref:Histone H1/5 n=1 Tax=Clonorchis sinensis TaxID=79923 RepID=G7Y5J6_CLOSI|nr:histone H1/5 [Clonorchis sinensis]